MATDWNNFVIPKKKPKPSETGLNDSKPACGRLRTPNKREERLVTATIVGSLSDRSMKTYLAVENIRMIENHILSDKFASFKGRVSANPDETFGFIMIGSNDCELRNIVNYGISVNWSLFSDLGSVDHGVPVHQYVDYVTPAPFIDEVKLRIVCFKTLRGESKEVSIDSASIEPSPKFNSHVGSNAAENQMSMISKCRSSVVYHFEFDANGIACSTPSALLPYAVFDLVPQPSEHDLTSGLHSRLRAAQCISEFASIVPSTGLFCNSRCKLLSFKQNERMPSLLNFSRLHINEEVFSWRDILKQPVIMSLLQQPNWGRLLNETEVEVKVDGRVSFVSHFGFWSSSSRFRGAVSCLQFNHRALIGFCGETVLYLIPNGQLASILGFANVEESVLHCIAVNAEHSAHGILSEVHSALAYEKFLSTTSFEDIGYTVDLQLYQRRVQECIAYNHVEMEVIASLDSEDVAIPIKKILRLSNINKATKIASVHWADNFGKSLREYREFDNHDGCDVLMSVAQDSKSVDEPNKHYNSLNIQPQELVCYSPSSPEPHIVRDEARSDAISHSISLSSYQQKYRANRGLRGSDDIQCILPTSSSATATAVHNTPRASWMPCLNGDIKGNLPLANPFKAPQDMQLSLRVDVVVVDPSLLHGLIKPADLDLFLKRMGIHRLGSGADHKVLIHSCIEEDIRSCLRDSSIDYDDRLCRVEYLRVFNYYRERDVLEKLDTDYCDGTMDSTHWRAVIHYLRTIISAKSGKHGDVNMFFLTDLKKWPTQAVEEDSRISFVDYRSWIKIFE